MKPAVAQDKDLIVALLAEAFDDNRSVNYVVKQDARRNERVRELMKYSFNICDSFGEVWLSDDNQACAMVLFPDKKTTTLTSILWNVRLAVSAIGPSRISQVLGRESKIKALHPTKPFAYLWFIGVDPALQNRGKGSELLEELISRYTAAGRPIYLETSVDRNLPWYKKHGFHIFETLQLTYPLFLLRRPVLRS